eukprot:1912565-Prymnesium_polylepis.1
MCTAHVAHAGPGDGGSFGAGGGLRASQCVACAVVLEWKCERSLMHLVCVCEGREAPNLAVCT